MSLTIEEFLNLYLVEQDCRKAYLFQPYNYDENNKIIKYQIIKRRFPNLNDTICEQGTIFSKINLDLDKINNDIYLANILSFCCPITYNDIPIKYSYDIVIKLINNIDVNLITYICDNGLCDIHTQQLCDKIKNTLLQLGNIIDVIFIKKTHYYEEYYINKLSKSNEQINKDDIDKINNYLYNIGFTEKLQDYIEYEVEFNNPIHRGILIGLLTQSKHNILEPFCPLDYYPKEEKNVNKIILKWENLIIDSFNLSKIKNPNIH
jgi:hypothetical protein